MPLPYRLGSNGPEILAWQKWFQRYAKSYAPPVDGYYGTDEAKAVNEMRKRFKLPPGDFDATVAARASYIYEPARPIPRIPTYVFRGTGGIIGEDIVSQRLPAPRPLVEEINTPYVPTMGGIPVGATEGGINDPSRCGAASRRTAAFTGRLPAPTARQPEA
jgi:peptidoglycan hydrolase-like protein with peptidoglycan-binding domain